MVSLPIEERILLVVAIVFLLATLGSLTVAAAHSVYAERRHRRRGTVLRHHRRLLVAAVVGDQTVDDTVRSLAPLSPRDTVRLFVDVGRALSGSNQARLHTVADRLGLVARAEAQCQHRSWATRLHAVRLLQVIGGGAGAVPPLLEDPVAEVRREAARWVSTSGSPQAVDRILRLADAPGLLDELTVIDALTRAGTRATVPVARYLEAPGPGLLPVLRAAQGIADARLLDPAVRLTRHEDRRVREAAAELLAAVGGEAATRAVLPLLDDEAPGVRRAALAALTRSRDWRHAGPIAAHLDDPDPSVRRSADRKSVV